MKKIFAAAAIAAAFIATPAFAQGYVGLGLGSSNLSGVDGTAAGSTLSGGNSSKGSVKVYGGFQLTPNWGVEAQYSDLGNRNLVVSNAGLVVATGSVKASQFSIAGTGTLPLASNFSLFGKLGVSSNIPKPSVPNASAGNATSLMAGVGVAYSITPKVAVRLEYEDFGKFSSNNGFGGSTIRANNYSVSVKYAF